VPPFFFVPMGTADSRVSENTRLVPGGKDIPIPPGRRTAGPGPHWRTPRAATGWHTDPAALRAAVEDAFGHRVGKELAS
jgi:hypothetical protein